MIITCAADFTDKGIEIRDKGKLVLFKKLHRAGDPCTVTFDDDILTDRQKQSRLFHALMNRYAAAQNTKAWWAKIELKYLYGEHVAYGPAFTPPNWTAARFVQMPTGYPDPWVYFKSVTIYTKTEWSRLIDGTIQACIEAGAEIGEVIE